MDKEAKLIVESFDEDNIRRIKKLDSGIILLPRKTNDGNLYPEYTVDLMKILRNAYPNLKTEMSDKNAQTESIHSADVILPTIQFATDVMIGVVSSIVSGIIIKFIESRIREGEKESTKV